MVAKELFPTLKYYVMPEGETWRFQHLLAPSMSNSQDGIVTPDLPKWLRHFKGSFGIPENQTPFRKIFISRDKARSRKVNNSSELLIALKGWESVTLEDLPIREQIKIFAEASHVLATHGAGLVNIMWCKEGTKIIEIQDEKALHKKVYPLLSNNLKLKHEVYVANTVQKDLNGAKPIGTKRWQMVDFEIDIPDLIRHLD
jgi:capsular polysaccharide biosynthesis protein